METQDGHQDRARLTPAAWTLADGGLHLYLQVTWASMCSM